ncbi:MAG: chromosomal replication initiator protein DnaA [Zetaproteobacteria bacterium]|nr:chromosomal replication initiator protein DnaA [Zetaproteobacteria bacterium]
MELWEQITNQLKTMLAPSIYEAWVSPAHGELHDNTFFIYVPSRMFIDGIKNNCATLLTPITQNLCGESITIEYQVDNQIREKINQQFISKPSVENQIDGAVDSRFDFNNFIVGSSNEFCHAACIAVANQPGENYNPLFIHGGVGLGKSHLIQATANHIHKEKPHLKIAYRRGENFTNELITAIKCKNTENFRSKYRHVDLLIIDDVQFIAGKESTQEELFNTFDALYELKKQIILVSDRHPKDMNKLDDRLKSRFGWGLVADIQPPELETRLAILKSKAEIAGVLIPDDICFLLASRITENVRDLEGALTRLVAYANLINREITMEMTKNTLKDILQQHNRIIQIEDIQKYICKFYNIKIQDLLSRKRTKNIAMPRQIAMFLSKELTTHSLPEIGEMFGGKDHTTILYGYRKIRDLITENKIFEEEIQRHIDFLKP